MARRVLLSVRMSDTPRRTSRRRFVLSVTASALATGCAIAEPRHGDPEPAAGSGGAPDGGFGLLGSVTTPAPHASKSPDLARRPADAGAPGPAVDAGTVAPDASG